MKEGGREGEGEVRKKGGKRVEGEGKWMKEDGKRR